MSTGKTDSGDGMTISERTSFRLQWAGIGSIVIATAALVGTYFGIRADIQGLRESVQRIQNEVTHVAQRIDGGPSRREYEDILSRVRSLELKRP